MELVADGLQLDSASATATAMTRASPWNPAMSETSAQRSARVEVIPAVEAVAGTAPANGTARTAAIPTADNHRSHLAGYPP